MAIGGVEVVVDKGTLLYLDRINDKHAPKNISGKINSR